MTLPFTIKLLQPAELAGLEEEWDHLNQNAADDNAYYSRPYLTALLATVARSPRIKILTCWHGTRLVGLMPLQQSPLAIPGLRPAGHALQTLYNYSCVPLIDKSHLEPAAELFVQELEVLAAAEWTIATINVEGATCSALVRALRHAGKPHAIMDQFKRAYVSRGLDYATHLTEHIDKDLRKNLSRRRRKLEEMGSVTHETHYAGDGLQRAIEAFLSIESSGWKGRSGTAMAAEAATLSLARTGFVGRTGKDARADLLLLDGKPIAAVLTLISGRTGFTVKMAYDEDYAKFSPSRLLELDILKDFLSGDDLDMIDASTDGPHMIDDFWPGRLQMGTLVFSLAKSLPRQRLNLYVASHLAKMRLKTKLKSILKRGGK